MTTTISLRRVAFKLAAVFLVGGLSACHKNPPLAEKSETSVRIAGEVFEGYTDPRALGKIDEALGAMSAYLQKAVEKPRPSDSATNLAIRSLDWGYYDDAFAFADLAAKAGDQRGAELRLLTNYLRGKRRSDFSALGAMPSQFYLQDFESLLDRQVAPDLAVRQFRNMVTMSGNDAAYGILALVTHPGFKNTEENMRWLTGEVTSFFAFHTAIDCGELDRGVASQTVDAAKHVFDPIGRFYKFSLVAAQLAKRFDELKDPTNAELWAKRAKVSLEAARIAGDWRPGWDSNLKTRAKPTGSGRYDPE